MYWPWHWLSYYKTARKTFADKRREAEVRYELLQSDAEKFTGDERQAALLDANAVYFNMLAEAKLDSLMAAYEAARVAFTKKLCDHIFARVQAFKDAEMARVRAEFPVSFSDPKREELAIVESAFNGVRWNDQFRRALDSRKEAWETRSKDSRRKTAKVLIVTQIVLLVGTAALYAVFLQCSAEEDRSRQIVNVVWAAATAISAALNVVFPIASSVLQNGSLAITDLYRRLLANRTFLVLSTLVLCVALIWLSRELLSSRQVRFSVDTDALLYLDQTNLGLVELKTPKKFRVRNGRHSVRFEGTGAMNVKTRCEVQIVPAWATLSEISIELVCAGGRACSCSQMPQKSS